MARFLLLASVALAMVACGGNVVVDPAGSGGAASSSSGASSTSAGQGGAPPAVVQCPQVPTQPKILKMVGKPCDNPNEVCEMSFSGCGGCYVKCVGGVWTADAPNGQVCYTIGTTC